MKKPQKFLGVIKIPEEKSCKLKKRVCSPIKNNTKYKYINYETAKEVYLRVT